MSDILQGWMIDYIKLLKDRVSPTTALNKVGVPLETFSEARINNQAFSAAVDLAEAGICSTEITLDELRKLREAQVSESRCAAYFGLTIDELRSKLANDEDLKRVYETGSGRGQAMIQIAQFEAAIDGDPTMLKHTGQHYLDQKDKILIGADLAAVDEMIKKLEAQLGQAEVTKLISDNVVDGEFEEVGDEEAQEN